MQTIEKGIDYSIIETKRRNSERNSMNPLKINLVDDNETYRNYLKEILVTKLK